MRASLFLYWIQKRRAVAADFAINNVTNFETSVTNLDRIGGVPCISTTPQYKYIMPDPIRARNRARERPDPCMETEHGIGEGIETEHKKWMRSDRKCVSAAYLGGSRSSRPPCARRRGRRR